MYNTTWFITKGWNIVPTRNNNTIINLKLFSEQREVKYDWKIEIQDFFKVICRSKTENNVGWPHIPPSCLLCNLVHDVWVTVSWIFWILHLRPNYIINTLEHLPWHLILNKFVCTFVFITKSKIQWMLSQI